MFQNFRGNRRENGPLAKQFKTERVRGLASLGRKMREEIGKQNQMTALRFQTRERHQSSPASLQVTTKQSLVVNGHILQHLITLTLKIATQFLCTTPWILIVMTIQSLVTKGSVV